MTSDRNENAKENARLAALGGLGYGVGKNWLEDLYIDQREKGVRATKDWNSFLKKLHPGDVVLSRASRLSQYKHGGDIATEDLLIPLKGSEYYHGGIYKGSGNQYETPDMDELLKSSRLKGSYPHGYKVYRPDRVTDINRALKIAEESKGLKYESIGEQLAHLVGHHTGLGSLKNLCSSKDTTTCTGLIGRAYGKIFPHEYIGPKDVMLSDKMKLVAKYGALKDLTLGQKVSKNLIYPAMKSVKYAAPAALAAYLLSSEDKEEDLT